MVNLRFEALKKAVECNGQFLGTDDLLSILKNYKDVSETSKAADYVKTAAFPSKIGNNKIGNDTIIININSGLNCWSYKKGHCTNSSCYARRDNRIYKDMLLANIAAEILFNQLNWLNIVECIINNHKEALESGQIRFIRFNEVGDFKGYDDFVKCNKIAAFFKKNYNIQSYAYTHNKDLLKHCFYINKSDIVLNWSCNGVGASKKTIIVNDASDLKFYENNKDFVICSGDCNGCSYCKDRKEYRTVVFVNHYRKKASKSLKEGLSLKEYNKLVSQKYKDYGDFLMRLED